MLKVIEKWFSIILQVVFRFLLYFCFTSLWDGAGAERGKQTSPGNNFAERGSERIAKKSSITNVLDNGLLLITTNTYFIFLFFIF